MSAVEALCGGHGCGGGGGGCAHVLVLEMTLVEEEVRVVRKVINHYCAIETCIHIGIVLSTSSA